VRKSRATIPSTFQLLDDTVGVADCFVDARTLQVRQKNHNVLLAQSVRKQILTQAFYPLTIRGYRYGGNLDLPSVLERTVLIWRHIRHAQATVRTASPR
jgi:hypothetical protein